MDILKKIFKNEIGSSNKAKDRLQDQLTIERNQCVRIDDVKNHIYKLLTKYSNNVEIKCNEDSKFFHFDILITRK